MSAASLDVLPGLYASLAAVSAITAKLGDFNGAPSIHTRRPVPVAATYPMIVVGPVITRAENDGINDYRPSVVIDVNVYGEQDTHYRDVDQIAEKIYGLFHRQRGAVSVTGYSVTQIRCVGPSPAPVDDVSRVGRRVTLTMDLYSR